MPTDQLPPQEWVSRSDWLARVLFRRRISSVTWALIFTTSWSLLTAIALLVLWLQDTPDVRTVWDYVSDPPNIVYVFIVIPIVASFYRWESVRPATLFDEIASLELVEVSEDERKHLFDPATGRVARLFSSPWGPRICAIVALSAEALELCQILLGNLSVSLPIRDVSGTTVLICFLILSPVFILGWYMICIIIIRLVSVIIGLRELFRIARLKIQPLHPDKCGGLRRLNQYALHVTYLIAVAGFGLCVIGYSLHAEGVLFDAPLLIAGLVAYMVLAPVLFFGTLGTAHASMKEAKESLIREISEQFLRDYEAARRDLSRNATEMKAIVEKLEQLQVLYRMLDSFPVWPFDAASVRKFAAAMLSSTIPLTLVTLVKWLLGKVLIS